MKTINTFLPALLLLVMQSVQAQFVSAPNSGANGVGHSVFFINTDTGFVAGEDIGKGVIQRTVNGGTSWTRVYTSAVNLEWVNDVFFVNNTTGFAVGQNGSILKSSDGGLSWNSQTVANVSYFNKVYFPSPQVGYAVGDGTPQGPIYKTTDGGNSWTAQVSGATGPLNDVFFINTLTGYAAGDQEVLKTTDGGLNWTSTPLQLNQSIYCSSGSVCYMGGVGIRKTSDGGNTWHSLVLPSLSAPNVFMIVSIDFTDLQTGYAVGAIYDTSSYQVVNGVILKTTNAGLTWNNINTPANNTLLQNKPLSSVCFTNAQTGYITGANGLMLKTSNGGTPPCNLTLSITATNSSCTQANGTATVVVNGGTSPYTYKWTNGDKAASADSLSAGLYMVLVTDASGCTDSKPVMINDVSSPTVAVSSVTHVSCKGDSNGAINILVSGGAPPYTYLWANGNTSQNMSNLQAGPHQVQVTDASGCMANKIVLVNEPANITLADSIKNASCGNADGAGWVFVSGGTQPYSYLWNTGATTSVISNIAAGSYSVMVTDNNGCKKSGMGTVINLGAAVAVVDSFIPADCGTGVGSIYISVSGGSPPYTYVWTNGATTQDLTGVPAGNYGVTIYSNGNPCTGAFSGTLPAKLPYTPDICIVTVDTVTGKNQCVFVKDSIANVGLKQYNFYRETTTAGVYQKLGSKPASQASLWTDQSANPAQRAWRYKITAEDSCGTEAPVSGLHKTIHLVANVGLGGHVNLIWDDYEGFSYSTFVIYRFTMSAGWDSLDAVPSNLHSYTDLNPPSPLTDVYYYIAVKNPSGCIVSSKYPDPMGSNLNLSKSNINKINPTVTGLQDNNTAAATVHVFPNPASGRFNVSSSIPSGGKAEVFDLMGRNVLSKSFEKGDFSLDLTGEVSGVYFLKIRHEKGAVTKKIVLQK